MSQSVYRMFQDREPARRRRVTDPVLAFVEPAYQLALHNPLLACHTLARGLRQQTHGGQLSAARELFTAIVGNDSYLPKRFCNELKQLAPR